jgi:tetratricopeptide (TPR) repeat protein
VTVARQPLPDSYESLLSQARTSYRTGNVEGAIALYRRLVEKLGRLSDRVLARRPELGDLYSEASTELASLLQLEGRFAEAIEVKEELLRTQPDQADTLRRDLAILRLAKGETEAGLDELRSLAEEDPDQAWNWIVLANESRIESRFGESRAALDRALGEASESDGHDLGNVYYHRFLLLRDMGQMDDAIAAWEEAVALNPDMADTVRSVYTMLADVGRYSEAQHYVARDENPLQAGFQRGLIAYLTGNASEAKQEWQAVARLDPEDFESGHDCWVEAVLRLGNPDPALEQLQKLLTQYGTLRLLILSGIGWAMRGDRELASALLQQATALLRRGRPPKQKLDSADWRLLDSLVADDEIKSALRPYFAVIETVWS